MLSAKSSIRVQFKGLTPNDINSLHDFLKSQKHITHVYSRVRTMDAAYDPAAHAEVAAIIGFAIGIGNAVGRKALDIGADCVREWLKDTRTQNANVEITLIYDGDENIVARVKKPHPPKPK